MVGLQFQSKTRTKGQVIFKGCNWEIKPTYPKIQSLKFKGYSKGQSKGQNPFIIEKWFVLGFPRGLRPLDPRACGRPRGPSGSSTKAKGQKVKTLKKRQNKGSNDRKFTPLQRMKIPRENVASSDKPFFLGGLFTLGVFITTLTSFGK